MFKNNLFIKSGLGQFKWNRMRSDVILGYGVLQNTSRKINLFISIKWFTNYIQ